MYFTLEATPSLQGDPFDALKTLQDDLVALTVEIMEQEDVPLQEALRLARAYQPALLAYGAGWNFPRVVTL